MGRVVIPALILAAALALPASTPPPDCVAACPAGAELVIVVTHAPGYAWQAREATAALDAAARWAPAGPPLKAAVVLYHDGGAALTVPMTADLAAVRAGIAEAKFAYSRTGRARDAAALALAQFTPGNGPCRLLIFFAYGKAHTPTVRPELMGAADILRRSGTPYAIGCPGPTRAYCTIPAQMTAPGRYTEAPDDGVLAGVVTEEVRDWRRGHEPWICETPTRTPAATPYAVPTPTTTETPMSTPVRYVPTATTTAEVVTPTARTYTPTMTHAPAPRMIYLPILPWQPCIPLASRADAVLVIDSSTSMDRPTSAGRSKHNAAIEAARAFVGDMRLAGRGGHDRVAVVAFNDTAWTATGLTDDAGAIGAALASLAGRTAQGTRLDLALDEAGQTISQAPPSLINRPVVILLTDGLPNRVPTPTAGGSQEDTVLAAAARLKAAGVRLYAVGLGDDVDRVLLAGVATAGDVLYAPDGEDLAAVYRQIAGRLIGCPAP